MQAEQGLDCTRCWGASVCKTQLSRQLSDGLASGSHDSAASSASPGTMRNANYQGPSQHLLQRALGVGRANCTLTKVLRTTAKWLIKKSCPQFILSTTRTRRHPHGPLPTHRCRGLDASRPRARVSGCSHGPKCPFQVQLSSTGETFSPPTKPAPLLTEENARPSFSFPGYWVGVPFLSPGTLSRVCHLQIAPDHKHLRGETQLLSLSYFSQLVVNNAH